jgi:hypothetical protein
MPIRFLVKEIDNSVIEKVIKFYNKYKLPEDEPLEFLNRCEGGFKINIPDMKNEPCNENKKIKQLRMKNGYLTCGNYIGFTQKEELLLYNALHHVLDNNVIYELPE